MRAALSLACVVIASTLFAADGRRESKPDDRLLPQGENSPEFADTERGCQGARILDYLERHGDWGVIDPESLLERTRENQRQMLDRSLRAFAIGGSVWTSLGPRTAPVARPRSPFIRRRPARR